MILFLFLFGIIMAWNEPVGSHVAGSWMARLDSGLRMTLFGQIFGFIFFLFVVMINWLFSFWTYSNKQYIE